MRFLLFISIIPFIMSEEYLSKVRAEAMRRIEAERFEAAVQAEMIRIKDEEFMAVDSTRFLMYHESRKAKLAEKLKLGQLPPTIAEIETAISELVLGNMTEDDLYATIERVDRNYPHTYANSRVAHLLKKHISEAKGTYSLPPTRAGIPLEFAVYLDIAHGTIVTPGVSKCTLNKIGHLNQFSPVRID
jgi:hypothetical protein